MILDVILSNYSIVKNPLEESCIPNRGYVSAEIAANSPTTLTLKWESNRRSRHLNKSFIRDFQCTVNRLDSNCSHFTLIVTKLGIRYPKWHSCSPCKVTIVHVRGLIMSKYSPIYSKSSWEKYFISLNNYMRFVLKQLLF